MGERDTPFYSCFSFNRYPSNTYPNDFSHYNLFSFRVKIQNRVPILKVKRKKFARKETHLLLMDAPRSARYKSRALSTLSQLHISCFNVQDANLQLQALSDRWNKEQAGTSSIFHFGRGKELSRPGLPERYEDEFHSLKPIRPPD
ncbi:uncharacterized protein TNIN_62301 [Trichonephila inaurata madagascariensis]|uniref:Uncharacterized protein n=1 Tax=Trichonephila inaurata madagascariensis TaxID=2747483 RepID=A0A8X6Y7M1_9ARAC|nr:uncharacterized protein TNIN_62301 [Trichonephila inaurata madagascariensis]